MRKPYACLLALTAAAAVGLAATSADAAPPVPAKLSWLGQSCFVLESAAGVRIVMDPIPKGIGYDLPANLRADVITISHEHPDHNNVGLVVNKPRVLRGLTADKKGWNRIEEKTRDVVIRTVGVYHDDQRGTKRGLNTIFVFEVGGLRIAHLGDLGHELTGNQLSDVGSVDILMVPVGGAYTLDAQQATRVVEQIRPRLMVIPMHFKTDALTIKELQPVDAFLAEKHVVRREKSGTLQLTGIKTRASTDVVVFDPAKLK